MIGVNHRQFSLLTWTSLIGQFFHPVGGEGMGYYASKNPKKCGINPQLKNKNVRGRNGVKGLDRYFSQLHVSLYKSS